MSRLEPYERVLRTRLRRATARRTRLDGQVLRPPEGTVVGEAGGFYYEKRGGVYSAQLPGQLYDQPDGRYLMALYPDELPEALPGDELALPGGRYRIVSAIDRGAYQTYRLEEIP